MPQVPVVVTGFSLRRITQPKGCDYQFPPIIEGLGVVTSEERIRRT